MFGRVLNTPLPIKDARFMKVKHNVCLKVSGVTRNLFKEVYVITTDSDQYDECALSQLIKRQICDHTETRHLICRANQLTCFYLMATLALSELILQALTAAYLGSCQIYMMDLFCKK